jgi:hypothetical protein
LRHLRLRNQAERNPSYLSNVSNNHLAFTRYEARGTQMAAATKTPEEERLAHKRAQRELTASVGTPLVRQEKKSRKRLFGSRRGTRTAIS